MENGYKILWTSNALNELEDIIAYLEKNWTEREIKNFVSKLESILQLISSNPKLFPFSEFNSISKAVITKHTVLYYRTNNMAIEIISLFSTKQSPSKRKLK